MNIQENKDFLENMRKEVDEIDRKIAELLNERSRKSLEIGRIKKELGLPLHSPERETAILGKILSGKYHYIPGEALKRIYAVILDESLALQKEGSTKKSNG